jgi:hypothetical protein
MDWFGLLASFLGMLAVVLLAMATTGNLRKDWAHIPVAKIAWGLLIIASAYLYITVPYFSSYHPPSKSLSYSNSQIDAEVVVYLKDQNSRIDDIESELAETKEELQELRNNYKVIVQIGWFAILYFGLFSVFRKKNGNSSDGEFRLETFRQ